MGKSFKLLLCLLCLVRVSATYAQHDTSKYIHFNHLVLQRDTSEIEQMLPFAKSILFYDAAKDKYNKEIWKGGVFDNWNIPNIESYFLRYDPFSKDRDFFNTSLVSIQKSNNKIVKLKFAFSGVDNQKRVYLNAIYNLIFENINGVYFAIPNVDYNTRNWECKIIGSIGYMYNEYHEFNEALAQKSNDFNNEIANFFDVPALKFTYYITENCESLYRLIGYDYNGIMFSNNQYSGLADVINNKIYAGNNSEWYPHEMVHLYIHKKFNTNNVHTILNEGFATWWGGTAGKDLQWHVQLLKKMAKERRLNLNDFTDLDNNLNAYSNLHSTIGGVLCEQAYKMYGKDKLWELVDNSNSEELIYVSICKVFGVDRDEVGKLILELLDKY